jgi:hypothetical protein
MEEDVHGFCRQLRDQAQRYNGDVGIANLALHAIDGFEQALIKGDLLEADLSAVVELARGDWPFAKPIGTMLLSRLVGLFPNAEAALRRLAGAEHSSDRKIAVLTSGHPQTPLLLAEELTQHALSDHSLMNGLYAADVIYVRKLHRLVTALREARIFEGHQGLSDHVQWLLQQIPGAQLNSSAGMPQSPHSMPEPSIDDTWWAMAALLDANEGLRSDFPSGEEPPDRLRQLLAYEQSNREFYSGYFEMALFGRLAARQYFGHNALAARFAVFGHDSDGSLYALWRHDYQAWDEAPVVYLDGEGSFFVILANSLDDFLGLLSLGITELGYTIHTDSDWPNKATPTDATYRFRAWLRESLDIHVPDDPRNIVEAALSKHPDLGAWITAYGQ